MYKTVVLSPYSKQFAYPSFWKLCDKLIETGHVYVYEPPRAAGKTKHLHPIFYLLRNFVRYSSINSIVVFGIYLHFFIPLIRVVLPHATIVSYQPELFEFSNKLYTKLFKFGLRFTDVFIDCDPSRLKLRRRYFSFSSITTYVLPNYPDSIKSNTIDNLAHAGKSATRFLYAGVIDDVEQFEDSLRRMKIPQELVDVYYTKVLTGSFDSFSGRVFEAQPFEEIVQKNVYHAGIVSYPFTNGSRRQLNNKYCAPSKVFNYLSAGLFVIHENNPTLRKLDKKCLQHDELARDLSIDSYVSTVRLETNRVVKKLVAELT